MGRLTFLRNLLQVRVSPIDLAPGKSCIHYMPIHEFALSLSSDKLSGVVHLTACYTDQLGKEHRSKPFSVDIDSWLALPSGKA